MREETPGDPLGVPLGLALGVARGVVMGVALGLAPGLALGLAFGATLLDTALPWSGNSGAVCPCARGAEVLRTGLEAFLGVEAAEVLKQFVAVTLAEALPTKGLGPCDIAKLGVELRLRPGSISTPVAARGSVPRAGTSKV